MKFPAFTLLKENKWLRRSGMVLCIAVLAYSLFQIGFKLYRYGVDDRNFEKIRSQVHSENSARSQADAFSTSSSSNNSQNSGDTPGELNALPYEVIHKFSDELTTEGILPEYSSLKSANPDMAGWILFPGFKQALDYPVMQAADNDFYLTRDFYKNNSPAGSVFMDSRNNPLQPDRHIILYGHSMLNLSMFGNLKDYPLKPEKHTKLTKVYLDLMNTRMEFEVFSTYGIDASYNYRQLQFETDEEYVSFLERIRSLSVYEYGVKLSAKDKILTLSTCNRTLLEDGRVVVHARLVRQIVYDLEKDSSGNGQQNANTAGKQLVSANGYLNQLSFKYKTGGKWTDVLLNPLFKPEIKEYEFTLPTDAEAFTLEAVPSDKEAKWTVLQDGAEVKAGKNKNLAVKSPESTIEIRVIPKDGKFVRTYIIKVIQEQLPAESPVPSQGEPSPSAASDGSPAPEATPASEATSAPEATPAAAEPATEPTPAAGTTPDTESSRPSFTPAPSL